MKKHAIHTGGFFICLVIALLATAAFQESDLIGKPKPHPVDLDAETLSADAPGDGYAGVAAAIGWDGAPTVIARAESEDGRRRRVAEFRQYLREGGIEVYDNARVHQYMNAMIDAMNDNRTWPNRYRWEWFPLEGRASSPFVLGETDNSGSIERVSRAINASGATFIEHKETYVLPIPAEALADAARIKADYPDVGFEVTRLTIERADPFLRVNYMGESFVIAQWDEPGFQK